MHWISSRDVEADGVRLFCLPHAGSGTAGFYRWKRQLTSRVAVCPVALPGREGHLSEPLLRSVEDVVAGLHSGASHLLDRPYAVFGHSMGALLAFEWVRRIEANGLRPPECLFVSGREAPQRTFAHRKLHTLSDEEFVAALGARYGGSPEELLADEEMRSVFLPILRADLEVVESYRFTRNASVGCPVMAFAGAEDRSVSDAGLAAWGEVTTGSFSSRRFAGDHFGHFGQGQAALLDVILEQLSK